jgi:hypothetical protein
MGQYNILDLAVRRKTAVQNIGSQRKLGKFVATWLVTRHFSSFLSTSSACAEFRDSNAELSDYSRASSQMREEFYIEV